MPDSTLKITQSKFDGGIANNSKSGPPSSCRFSRNLAIYEDSDSVTLNPIPVKDSGDVVTDLVKCIADATPYTNDRYAYGDAGNIYKIGSSWTINRTVSVNGAAGQGLVVFNNNLYYMTSTSIGKKGYLNNNPAYDDDFISSNNLNLDQANTASASNTYTTLSSISEAATNLLSFTPQYDPIKEVAFNINTIGTGDWTVTLHDSSNNVLGTVTILNASMSTGIVRFTFSSPIRLTIGNSYHFHFTTSTGDGIVATVTASDFSTAYFAEYCGVLLTDTDYHPGVVFTNGVRGIIVVGNEEYLAVWDELTYNPNKIRFEPGFKVRSIFTYNEYIVAACWKGTSVDSFEYGRLYYWNGTDPYFSYFNEITSGLPNAAINSKQRVFTILGSSGDIAIGDSPIRQIQPAPKLTRGKKAEVMANAIAVWQRRVHFGYFSNDDSTGLEPAVYEFGNQSDRAITYTDVSTEVLNHGYQSSSGKLTGPNVKIGCVQSYGRDMYISWYDGNGNYFVDKVTKGGNPAATGSWESFIHDEGVNLGQLASMPEKSKLGRKVVVSYQSLPVGCTVTPKYRLDRATTGGTNNDGWILATTPGIAGTTRSECIVNGLGGGRYKEVEFGFDVTATTNYPLITCVYWEYDPLVSERGDS